MTSKMYFSRSKTYFALNSTPSPPEKLSPHPFESYWCSLSFLRIPQAQFRLFLSAKTFFVKIPSFFDNSFHLYPVREKSYLADSEKRTPEITFRPFLSSVQKSNFAKKNNIAFHKITPNLSQCHLLFTRRPPSSTDRVGLSKVGEELGRYARV